MDHLNKQTAFLFKHNINALVKADDLLFIIRDTKLYLSANCLPTFSLFNNSQYNVKDVLCFGSIGSQNCFCYLGNFSDIDLRLDNISLKTSYSILSDAEYQAAILANHLLDWLLRNKYCGSCKGDNIVSSVELALRCTQCEITTYPTIAPVVIGLIYKNDEILLAKSNFSTANVYGCISGFVNPNENLEAALKREVNEEVGLQIKNIKYVASQYWPFPNSLMVGFFAEYLGGDIVVDKTELKDANWFKVSEINKLPQLPNKISISRYLIDEFCKL